MTSKLKPTDYGIPLAVQKELKQRLQQGGLIRASLGEEDLRVNTMEEFREGFEYALKAVNDLAELMQVIEDTRRADLLVTGVMKYLLEDRRRP